MPSLAVIGAGFSGTMVAAHVLRRSTGPLHMHLIDRSARFGPGVAYGTSYPDHLLNVPAGNMSALADDTEHFVRWARHLDPHVTGGSFMPRMLYGQYLEWILEESARMAVPGAKLQRIGAAAVGVDVDEHATKAAVVLDSGERLEVDRVVLATGNYPPIDPLVGIGGGTVDDRAIRDPWGPGALESLRPGEPALLIGSGLTMLDIAISLRLRGLATAIHAISRHGLLPQPHRLNTRPPDPRAPKPPVETWDRTALGLLRGLRQAVRDAAVRGADWRDVVTSIRPVTPALWQSLPSRERARFLAHLRPYWDSHRHRAAPHEATILQRMFETGRLVVHAGRLRRIAAAGSAIEVTWQPRGEPPGATQVLRVGSVINCTGPCCDFRRMSDPLVVQLLHAGLIMSDPFGLGLETSQVGAAINAHGEASNVLFVAGPARRVQFWEHTAVPELRVHAAALADHLVSSVA